jgi:AcrR family transcriptional regulator
MSEPALLFQTSTKREQTKLANRLAILDAARTVFLELGYEAASVRDIIRRTGLSVGAFYNYFRSKEDVFEALADDGARRFKVILRAQDQKNVEFGVFLHSALLAFFSFQVEEQKAYGPALEPASRRPQVRVETPEQLAVFQEVKVLLCERIRRGGAPRVDPDFLAAACIGVAREVCDRMLAREPIDVEAAADFATRMISGGIAALPRLSDHAFAASAVKPT